MQAHSFWSRAASALARSEHSAEDPARVFVFPAAFCIREKREVLWSLEKCLCK